MCSIPFPASCFASVDLKEKDEFNRFFQIDQLNSTVSSKYTKAKQLAGKGIEHILPPKPTRRLLPCLLIPSPLLCSMRSAGRLPPPFCQYRHPTVCSTCFFAFIHKSLLLLLTARRVHSTFCTQINFCTSICGQIILSNCKTRKRINFFF